MDGIQVSSSDLLDFMSDHKIYALRRHFSRSVPGDTIKWNRVREKYVTVPDLSKHYDLLFSLESNVMQTVASLDSLRVVDNVSYVPVPSSDGEYEFESDEWIPDDPMLYKAWQLKEKRLSFGYWENWGVRAYRAWDIGPRGNTAVIAIVQDGVNINHPDLADNYLVGGGGDPYLPGDGDHGTGMAGLACAVGDNGIGTCGVAPYAKFLPYNYHYPVGGPYDTTTKEDDICLAIEDSVDVICISWNYGDLDYAPLHDVVEEAYECDIPFVCSAGDLDVPNGVPFRSYPSLYTDWTISVGAHTLDGSLWDQSNYGWEDPNPDSSFHFIDVTAPGFWTWTTAKAGDYTQFTGTSAASPIAAGVVALAKGFETHLTVDYIQRTLKVTADSSLLDLEDSLKFGKGRIDAYEFMKVVYASTHGQDDHSDSAPYIIVTDSALAVPLQQLADTKTKLGTPTEVLLTDDIYASYSGEDAPAKIRSCIKHYYENNHLEYVLLAGDGSIIPFREVFNEIRGDGVTFISDYYYACLDGNWNYDGDTLYGEVADSVDLVPEVAVGRLPFSTSAEVDSFLVKLSAYESDTTSGWRQKALLLGSQMYRYQDGKDMCEQLSEYFPGGFAFTELYDDSGSTVEVSDYQNAMNTGQGIVVKHGLASNAQNYYLHRSDDRRRILPEDVDSLENHRKPSVVLSSTCWNHELDLDCIAKHYMKHPSGGAVAYVGSSYNDYSYSSFPLRAKFLDALFGEGPKEIGKLLNLGKLEIEPNAYYDGGSRHTMFSYLLSGDPQMRIWTAEPQSLTISAPYWLSWDQGPQDFDISVTSSGSAVESVLVCISHDDGLYELAYTDEYGNAHFENVEPPQPDSGDSFITICASKHNYFTQLDDTTLRFTNCNTPGDADANCIVNISDADYVIAYTFGGGPAPPVLNRGDADGNCIINISDGVYLVAYIFGGGGAPDIGCVTQPPGGKFAGPSHDPSDPEGVPADLSPTDLITITVQPGDIAGSKLIQLTSDRRIHGLSLTLRGYEDSPVSVERLTQDVESQDITWHRYGNLIKIGIIDKTGQRCLPSGSQTVLRVNGDFELMYSLAACITEDWQVVTLMPEVTNLDTLVSDFEFEPNYPNPFNPSTTISFALPRSSQVKLEVYNVLGQKVRTLANELYPAGRHTIEWDGRDDAGNSVASGIYFSRFQAGEYTAKRKMVIAK